MTTHSDHLGSHMDSSFTRSPRNGRQQQLHRQMSRPFDAYGTMPNAGNMYQHEDPLGFPRFDGGRTQFNPSMQSGHINGSQFNYDLSASQSWNPNGNAMPSFGGPPSSLLGPSGSMMGQTRLKPSRGRGALSNVSLDAMPNTALNSSSMQQVWADSNASMSPFGGYDSPRMGGPPPRQDTMPEVDEELIPTAIVIKNIPFAVKKEQLVNVMTEMGLPLPYAFNYHFDNGVFRGLAFANFTSADETAAVIGYLNHFELQGRKLRVEYKKMLPVQERERIEREKRERRGQLEEQHRPMAPAQLHGQGSMSSLSSQLRGQSPAPLAQRTMKPGNTHHFRRPEGELAYEEADIDMNDPTVLEFFTQLAVFKSNQNQEVLIFPADLHPNERRIIHTLAHQQGLSHLSRGTGDERQVHVYKTAPGTNVSPPNSSVSAAFHSNEMRRNLNRSATTDFGEARQGDNGNYNTLRGQNSVGLLGVHDNSTGFGANAANLRAAKSYADLRSWTPSPAPSHSSYTAVMQNNGSRLQQHFEGGANGSTPNLTPTTTGTSGLGLGRDDNFVINGIGSMSLGHGFGSSTSPRRQRSAFSPWENDSYTAPAPIGSNRSVSHAQDTNGQERLPPRQPRGPSERQPGFGRRQNGRSSDELRSGPPIIVE